LSPTPSLRHNLLVLRMAQFNFIYTIVVLHNVISKE